jgi:hypothetical protein
MAIHQSNCVFHCGYYIKIFSPPSLIGFIFLISQMTVVLAPDIYRAQWYIKDKHATFLLFRQIKFIYSQISSNYTCASGIFSKSSWDTDDMRMPNELPMSSTSSASPVFSEVSPLIFWTLNMRRTFVYNCIGESKELRTVSVREECFLRSCFDKFMKFCKSKSTSLITRNQYKSSRKIVMGEYPKSTYIF